MQQANLTMVTLPDVKIISVPRLATRAASTEPDDQYCMQRPRLYGKKNNMNLKAIKALHANADMMNIKENAPVLQIKPASPYT